MSSSSSAQNSLSRRVLLSTLAMLPMLSASLRPAPAQGDPLASWNEGTTKDAITTFVARVTYSTVVGPSRAVETSGPVTAS